jgi:transglutaminase-like putative cysteine protease
MLGIASRLETLPTTNNGLDAVRATLRKMVAIVRKYSADMTTVSAASAIIRQAGITDTRTQRYQTIKAIQNWVRDHIGYAHDPNGTEMIQTPPATLNRGFGDCDDKAILVCALLTALGFDCEFLAVGGSGQGWDTGCAVGPSGFPDYSHVLAAVRYGGQTGRKPPFLDGWLTLETIVPSAGPGWFPRGVRVVMPARI